jgi:hypothetical protein
MVMDFGNVEQRVYAKNINNTRIPIIVYAAYYIIIFRDIIRVSEYISGSTIPLNLFGLILVTIATGMNIFSGPNSQRVSFLRTFEIILIVNFVILFLRKDSAYSDLRDFVGLYYIQCGIPLFIISVAIKYDLVDLLIKNSRARYVVLFPVIIGIFQILYQYFDRSGFVAILDDLRRGGLIANPYQTAFGQFQIRIMSIFYSAFAFNLIILWAVAYILFLRRFKVVNLIFITILFALQITTYNRNGLLMLSYLLVLWVAFHLGSSRRTVATFAAAIVTVWLVSGPFILSSLDLNGQADNSYLLKVGTLSQRVIFWNSISTSDFTDWLFGTGFVQGFEKGRVGEEFFVDNFLIYNVWQNGLIIAFLFIAFNITLLFSLVPKADGDRYRSFVFAIYSAGLVGFTLNITFFEPLFQTLYLSLAVSLFVRESRPNKPKAAALEDPC